jgi:hypothetical protein
METLTKLISILLLLLSLSVSTSVYSVDAESLSTYLEKDN